MNRATLPPESEGNALDVASVAWTRTPGLVAYQEALSIMDARVDAIARGEAGEWVWLLQHPPLYTAGTSARAESLLEPRFPVIQTGRGGQFTYHGPGQRVVYVMLDLNRRGRDVRAFVSALEQWLIVTLNAVGVQGERRADRVGVWVRRPDKGPEAEDKIAAIGVRVRRWVTMHGISLNVSPCLADFGGIEPCGIVDPRHGVTSLADLGHKITLEEVDGVLRTSFETVFGPTYLAD